MSEVFSYEDLRLILKCVRSERSLRQYKHKKAGREGQPRAIEQLDRIERILSKLAEAKLSAVRPRADNPSHAEDGPNTGGSSAHD